jgi:hypothetical protein
MTLAGHVELTEQSRAGWTLSHGSFSVLNSPETSTPTGRSTGRVNAYVMHYRLMHVANNGAACDALLHRVMANIGRALRHGVLTRGKPSAVGTLNLPNDVAGGVLPGPGG